MVEQEMDEETKKEAEDLKQIKDAREKQKAASQKSAAAPTPADANDDELPDLAKLIQYEVPYTKQDGSASTAVVYVNPDTKQIEAYDVSFKAKDPNGPPVKGVMYVQGSEAWVDKGSGLAEPYSRPEDAAAKRQQYQTGLDKLLADRKAAEEAAKKAAEQTPVPPAETPKEEVVEDLIMEDGPGLETKVATAAPAPAKGMEYKFVDGIWSAYVAVYDGGKKIGEYSAFGGIVKGPNVDKLAKPVLERIKEEYFNGMKGK
jgi:hypothetical protein